MEIDSPMKNNAQASGHFKSRDEAEQFREQYYYDEIVIAEIIPLNMVLPERVTELDIDFVPENVVDIKSRMPNPNKH
jgi:hypothetical protein